MDHTPFRQLSAGELQRIDAVADAYRKRWGQMRQPPFECNFDGTKADIDALDYFDYEGIAQRADLEGAALIWGRVVVKNLPSFSWLTSDRNDYLIGTLAPEWPRFLIWPFARLLELEHTSAPQFGKFEWLLQQVMVQYALNDGDVQAAARLLSIQLNDGFFHYAPLAMKELRRMHGAQ